MRNYIPDEKACNITILAGTGYTQIQIAKEINMTESAVSQRINTLQKYHYLIRKKSGAINTFGLEPLGVMLVTEMAHRGIKPLNKIDSEPYKSLVRIHNIQLRWDILRKRNPEEYLSILQREKIEYTLSGTENHPDPIFTHKKYTVVISGISLILRCQERIGRDSDVPKLLCDIFDDAKAIALEMEDMFGIKLTRMDKDTMCAHFTKLEIALLDNPLAKVINESEDDNNESD